MQSIRTEAGAELLWQAGPQWRRHAPALFPIVGRLSRDTLVHHGASYPMSQHGFARDRSFRFVTRSAKSCRLALRDDQQSRAIYPLAFELEIGYRVTDRTLSVKHTLRNPSPEILPASLEAHAAFVWPLDPALPPKAHTIEFACDETARVRRLQDGLLRPEPEQTPIEGCHLRLSPALFEADALILEHPVSTSLRYGVYGGAALRLEWSGFSQLGLWGKPGACFLCIEPWSGLASPIGFDGEFEAKPQILLIPPGGCHQANGSLAVENIA